MLRARPEQNLERKCSKIFKDSKKLFIKKGKQL
jgi:hypothetical protein